MSIESTAIKARTKRYGLLNDLYLQYSKLRIAAIGVATVYQDGDERDEKAYNQVLEMIATATNKCDQLEVFLLKEKEVLTRMMASEDCAVAKELHYEGADHE